MIHWCGYSTLCRVAAWSLLAVLGLATGGCAALRGAGPEDAASLEMDGPFRGRWWSYYDRGRAWQKQGNFEAAERDLRIALQSRGKDSLWPRTYGMHFIPEYFPHRELGINLYHQDQNDNAIDLLETSLEQQYSARAAYYFKEAHLKRLQSGASDSASPSVEILSETEGLNVTTFELSGIARDDSFVSAIEIDGTSVDVRVIDAEVPFSKSIALAPGQNSVHIRVTDLAGNSIEQDVSLQNDLDGPAVSFDPLVAGTGIVSGKVFDPSGVSSLMVGGVEARLVDESPGLASFDVAVPFGAALDFSSADALGNVTFGQVPLENPEGSTPPEAVALASNSPAHAAEFMRTEGERMAATMKSPKPISIDLENIPEGAEYYQDDIVVSVRAKSNEPIANVTLLKESIPVVPARNDVFVTRRVSFDKEKDVLYASIVDVKGNQAEARRNVRRVQNELEVQSNKLAVVLMASPETPGPLTDGIISEIYGVWDKDPTEEGKTDNTLANRFTLVEREKLAAALQEQTLSAELSSAKEDDRALIMGRFISFEVMLDVQTKLEDGILEIWVYGVSSETSSLVTGRIEVAGEEKELDDLLKLLALRILQEFPRAQGDVITWNNPRITFTVTSNQGSRESRKCLIFRVDEKEINGTTYTLPNVVAEGLIVGADPNHSTADVVKTVGDADLESLALGEGHYVVLK